MKLPLYRSSPVKENLAHHGCTSFFRYGANQITGWRLHQEDRTVCCAELLEGFSFFGVYDGHGGEEVAEYLKRNLHHHVRDSIIENPEDIELALYLAFLICNFELKNMTEEEHESIVDDLEETFMLPGVSLAGSSRDEPGPSGIGAENGSENDENIKQCIRATALSELARVCVLQSSSMVEALLKKYSDEDDEDDEDYNVDEDMKNAENSNSSGEESDSSDDSSDVSDDNCGASDDDIHASADGELEDKTFAHQDLDNKESQKEDIDCSGNKDVDGGTLCLHEEVKSDSPVKETSEESNAKDTSVAESSCPNDIKSDSCIKQTSEESNPTDTSAHYSENEKMDIDSKDPLVGIACGSTATVVVLDRKKVYIANVGDSKCVASVKGEAITLSLDHVPTDKEEHKRIRNAGFKVTHGRIANTVNLSRAFGDFALKIENAAEPFQPLSCEPYINILEITEDLDFIVIASDGIWNELSPQDVIDFIKERQQQDAVDICTELFEVLLPEKETKDGSGCDNMSAIIIFFEDSNLQSYIEKTEKVRYNYGELKEVSEDSKEKDSRAAPSDNDDDISIVKVILPPNASEEQLESRMAKNNSSAVHASVVSVVNLVPKPKQLSHEIIDLDTNE